MSTKFGREADGRLNIIFSSIKEGLPTDQIDERLREYTSRRKIGIEHRMRGLRNEARVAKLLRDAPYVERVRRTAARSPEDEAGYDMYAYLHGIDLLDAVGVQVKSSQLSIDNFLASRMRE